MVNIEGLPSVNRMAAPLVQHLVNNSAALRVHVNQLSNGTTLIDAGMECDGSMEAGRIITEICLGGLGTARFRSNDTFKNWAWSLDVSTSHPVIACLGSQYAGWSLEHKTDEYKFLSLGSGPARAMGSNEELFDDLGYRDTGDSACLVLEVSEMPPVEIAETIAQRCGIEANGLTLILTPTTSLAGSVQVVGRSLEVALHKLHTLEFPLSQLKDGFATAPLCPPHSNFIKAMGRTNDSIMFGGNVHLLVACEDSDAESLAIRLPSSTSKDYGKPFAQIFKESGYKFYDIDPMLFSPAKVTVTNINSGKSFHAGKLDESLLEQSFA